jgi:polyribonucleotide nucleotidyltransferase
MKKAMTVHRPELSPYAPRIEVMQINKDKIREVIGPGGKVIRNITEQTGVKIDIEDDGTIHLYSPDADALKRARRFIENIVAEAEVGVVYRGKVRRIVEFGAFVEILPGTDGLVHISEISKDRIRRVSDVLHEGDEVIAKCIRIDRDGKVSLSMKQAEGMKPTAEGSGGDDRAQGQN